MCVCVSMYELPLLSTAKILFLYTPIGESTQQISILHHVTDSSVPFTIDCRGSGSLSWTSPTGNTVSLNTAVIPSQQTTGPLSRTLSFQSWSEELNGLYTCSSDVGGVSKSLTITNSKSNDTRIMI